jgi:hypothetical protein
VLTLIDSLFVEVMVLSVPLVQLWLQVYIVRGNVNESLTVQVSPRHAAACGMGEPPPPRTAWVKEPYPEDAAMQYWFTKCVRTLVDWFRKFAVD